MYDYIFNSIDKLNKKDQLMHNALVRCVKNQRGNTRGLCYISFCLGLMTVGASVRQKQLNLLERKLKEVECREAEIKAELYSLKERVSSLERVDDE